MEMLQTATEILVLTAWPLALMLAWVVGELGYRWLAIPRISSYGIAGFALGASQFGLLSVGSGGPLALLADFAFGLILFELGYRINLNWLRNNPWLLLTSLCEAALSFACVFVVADWFAVPLLHALLLSALAMSTSPACVLRVINETRSSGQVTERTLHLSALNCVLAVVTFKLIVGYGVLATQGSFFVAVWNSLVVLLVSTGLGVLFGAVLPGLLRTFGGIERNATVGFAISILMLTALTHALKFSPLLAALAFGLVARHRRLTLSSAQRNFGALGDFLTVLLFVFVAAGLDWKQAVAGIWIALALVATRMAVKTLVITAFARVSGITWRKGVFTGLALTPLSVFAILLLEQTRYLGLGLLDEMVALAAIVLLLEVAGPIITQRALVWAGEAPRNKEA